MVYSIKNLKKQYGDRIVLNIASLEIEDGRIYALFGPNGAGKSTLLNILGFLTPPTSGTIFFDSEPASYSVSTLNKFRRKAVLVDQNPILFTTTVFSNVEFGLKIRKIPKEKRKKIVYDALDLVGMSGFADSWAHKLSGGETQRVALARAVALSPAVLLCDEPFANVDTENQAAVIHILKQINKHRKITILFTTHDRLQMAALTDDIFYLDKGRLVDNINENIFNAVFKQHENTDDIKNERATCIIQDTIDLPTGLSLKGKKKISFDPRLLQISGPEKSEEAGLKNGYCRGRILQTALERDRYRVVVDCGINISVIMSECDFKKLKPVTGEKVSVYFPENAMSVLE